MDMFSPLALGHCMYVKSCDVSRLDGHRVLLGWRQHRKNLVSWRRDYFTIIQTEPFLQGDKTHAMPNCRVIDLRKGWEDYTCYTWFISAVKLR